MRYDRKIKYLDYLENGERIRGSGFLKIEILGNSLKIEITVKGVRDAKEFAKDVILCGNGREEVLGQIQLEGGQGEFRHICHISAESGDTIDGTGIGYDELTGIKIPLGEGREIVCIWDTSNSAARSSAELSPKPSAEPSPKPAAELLSWPSAKPPAEHLPEQAVKAQADLSVEPTAKQQEKVRKKTVREHTSHSEQSESRREVKVQEFRETEEAHSERSVSHREETLHELRETEAARPDRKAQEQQPETVPLMENKWLQLCAIYPHINPFRDQREYLSIGPEDFVLFSSDSYKAASNSFMLHGYYNYRHLILAREERRGDIVYYVGVPGNYYDREKQVAIMFGFESFECAQEPAQSSDFGYYMMKVQL